MIGHHAVYLYLSIYLSISIYLCIYVSIPIYLSLSISIYLYLSLSIYLYQSTSINLSLSIYPYLSMYRGHPRVDLWLHVVCVWGFEDEQRLERRGHLHAVLCKGGRH